MTRSAELADATAKLLVYRRAGARRTRRRCPPSILTLAPVRPCRSRCAPGGSSAGERLQELHQSADGYAGAALRRVAVRFALVVARARDVEVTPAHAVRYELLEEDAGDEHPAIAVARVGDVGHLGVDRLAELFG